MDALVNILFNPADINVKTTVKSLALDLYDLIRSKLRFISMPHLEQCRPIFPLITELVWDLFSGQLDSFLDLFAHINNLVYEAVDKKCSLELTFAKDTGKFDYSFPQVEA